MLGHVKRLKPFRAIRKFYFLQFFKTLMSIVVKQKYFKTCSPHPQPWEPRVFDLLMYAERREFDNSDCCWGGELDGIWDLKRIETNCLNHVKLCLVSLQRNTLIKLWRVWNSGKFVFVSVSPIFLVAVAKQIPGVGYMAAHLQQKNPF